MIYNALITAFKTRKLVDKLVVIIPAKPDPNEYSFKSKYQQRRISNRLF